MIYAHTEHFLTSDRGGGPDDASTSQQDGVTRPNSGAFSAITPMSGGRSPPPADLINPIVDAASHFV